MKLKGKKQWVVVGGVALLTGGAILLAIQVYVKHTLNLQTVYVAGHTLSPRTLITEEDIVKVDIPKAYILEDTYTGKENIIGKYTDIQGTIPAGSPFYFSMLHQASSLPDAPTLQLKEDQAVYTLSCNGINASFESGERVDLFLQVEQRNDTTAISGPLLKNVRILSIQDHKGTDIKNKESTKSANWILCAVNCEDLEVLTYAETLGSIRLYSTSASYAMDTEATRAEDSVALSYVLHCLKEAKQTIQGTLQE